MEKDILDVTRTNYDFFISKYGIITDSEIAKQLLCITTNAWYVLDDYSDNCQSFNFYKYMIRCV